MSTEAPANVVFVPGLYWNLPGVGEHNRQVNNTGTVGALRGALGELAMVELHDAGYHDEGTPQEKEEALDSHITELAERAGQPVSVAGSSLGGNLAVGAALRLGPDIVAKGVGIAAPFRANGSPPPGLRVKGGEDMVYIDRVQALLADAGEDELSRLTSVHGTHDIFVKPAWSQWPGVETRTVPGFWHPGIIKKALGDASLMQAVLLENQPIAE